MASGVGDSRGSSEMPAPLVEHGENSTTGPVEEILRLFEEEEQTMVAGEMLRLLAEDSSTRHGAMRHDSDDHSVEESGSSILSADHALRLSKLRHRYNLICKVRAILDGTGGWRVLRELNGIKTSLSDAVCYDQDVQSESGSASAVCTTDDTAQDHAAMLASASSASVPDPRTRIYSIILEGEVALPFFPFLTLLNEVELYPSWIPSVLGVIGLRRVDLLERTSRTDFTFRVLVGLCPPFANRRTVLRITGHDCMTERDKVQQVVVLLWSIPEAEEESLLQRARAAGRLDPEKERDYDGIS